MLSPFPRSKSPNIGHPSRVTMEDHGFRSNNPNKKGTQPAGQSMGTRWMGTYGPPDIDWYKKRKRAEEIAKSFSSIKFNFGRKDKGGTRDITAGNNVRSGGGQRYTKPDTLFT